MKRVIITCDYCKNECQGDYFSIYKNSRNHVIWKSHICESCFPLAIGALKAELNDQIELLPVSSYEELCKFIPDNGVEALEKSIKEAIEFRTLSSEPRWRKQMNGGK